jgi:phosphate transport system ATP-binding protein
MQQASRVSRMAASFRVGPQRAGHLVETGATAKVFTTPGQRATEDDIPARFG